MEDSSSHFHRLENSLFQTEGTVVPMSLETIHLHDTPAPETSGSLCRLAEILHCRSQELCCSWSLFTGGT